MRELVDALEFFAITLSLGSVESLVMLPQLMQARDLTPERVASSGIGNGIMRLSIGIANTEDLIENLKAALSCTTE